MASISSRFRILIYPACIIFAGFLVFTVLFKRNHGQVQQPRFEILRTSNDFSKRGIPTGGDRFPRIDYRESFTKIKREFWKSTKPSFDCSEKKKVGKDGDGGKWTCGLRTLAIRTVESHYPCVIYSFGVHGESSFEEEILQVSHCQIFAYDMSTQGMGPEIKKDNPRVKFQPQGISGGSNATMKTLKEFMDSNGHSWIDILKMDVEKSEYASLDRVFSDFEHLPFGQLLIELHSYNWKEDKSKAVNLLKGLEDRGMRLFNVELNPKHPDCCSEYSFINIYALDLFGQDNK